jgi:hypothetical protein
LRFDQSDHHRMHFGAHSRENYLEPSAVLDQKLCCEHHFVFHSLLNMIEIGSALDLKAHLVDCFGYRSLRKLLQVSDDLREVVVLETLDKHYCLEMEEETFVVWDQPSYSVSYVGGNRDLWMGVRSMVE